MIGPGQVQRYLESPEAAADWLRGLGVRDLRRGHASLRGISAAGVPLDLLAVMFHQLSCRLPQCADADMALNNLERFVAAARNPLAIGTLFERDPDALPVLLQIFSTSQYLSDLLIIDPEGFDLLRLTEGQPVSRQALVDELVAEVQALEHEQTVLRALRRFKRRETLRIAYGDIIREQSLATVTAQISYLADAIVEAALRAAYRKLTQQRGTPRTADGQQARLAVLGLGKLGGLELNYSSDIDLVLFYDGDGRTDGPRTTTNAEFFEHLARELVRMLTESTELGAAYRVDFRLRPEGRHGPMVASVQSALAYYDLRGRTWERQAYIKARPVAGDLSLGQQFLQRLASWVYPRYLSAADIAGIKALRRRIEQQGRHAGQSDRNVKTGRGGIRDIEFAIQFLQLLKQRPLVTPLHRLQDSDVEATPGDGGQHERPAGRRTQPFQAPLNGVLDAPRDREPTPRPSRPRALAEGTTGRQQRLHHLFHKEGIALGQGVDRLQQPGRDRVRLAHDCLEHPGGLRDRQPSQDEFAGQSLAVQGGEEVVDLRAEVVGAIGQQEQDRLFVQVAGEVEQELEAGLIAPVEVLDGDTQGVPGLAAEEAGQSAEQTPFLLTGLGRRQRREIGQHRGQVGQASEKIMVRGTRRGRGPGGPGDRQRVEQVQERRVRERAVGLEAAPQQDRQAKPLGAAPGLRQEARLADTGLTRDQHRLAVAIPGPDQPALQGREGSGAADKNRADHRLAERRHGRGQMIRRRSPGGVARRRPRGGPVPG